MNKTVNTIPITAYLIPLVALFGAIFSWRMHTVDLESQEACKVIMETQTDSVKEIFDGGDGDISNPKQHGGCRAGADCKKDTSVEKAKLGWRVSVEAKDNIEKLAEDMDYSAAELADYIMKNLKKAPKTLD